MTPERSSLDLGRLSGNGAADYIAALRLDSDKTRARLRELRQKWLSWFRSTSETKSALADDLAALETEFKRRPLLPEDAAARRSVIEGLGATVGGRADQADRAVRGIGEELAEARVLLAELGDVRAALAAKPGRDPDAGEQEPRWRSRLKALAERLQAPSIDEPARFHLTAMGFGAAASAEELEDRLARDGRLTAQEAAALAEIAKKGLGPDAIEQKVGEILEGTRARGGDVPDPGEISQRIRQAAAAPARLAPASPAIGEAAQAPPGFKVAPPPMTLTRAGGEASPPRFSLTPLQGVALSADMASGKQAAYLAERKNWLVKRAEALRALIRSERPQALARWEEHLARLYAEAEKPDFDERLQNWIDGADRFVHSGMIGADGELEASLRESDAARRKEAARRVGEVLGQDSSLLESWRGLDQASVSALAAKARAGGLDGREARLWEALNGYWQARGEDELSRFYQTHPERKALSDLEARQREYHAEALAAGDVPPGLALRLDEVDRERLAARLGMVEALDPAVESIRSDLRRVERIGATAASDGAYIGVTVRLRDGSEAFVAADRSMREAVGKTADGTPVILRRYFDGSGRLTALEQADPASPRRGLRHEGSFGEFGDLREGTITAVDPAGAVEETEVRGGRQSYSMVRDADGDLVWGRSYKDGGLHASWDRRSGRTAYYERLASTPERPFRVGGKEVELTVIRVGSPDRPVTDAYYEPPSVPEEFERRAREALGGAASSDALSGPLARFHELAADPRSDPAARRAAFSAVVRAASQRGERREALAALERSFATTQSVRHRFFEDGRITSSPVETTDFGSEGSGESARSVVAVSRPGAQGEWAPPSLIQKSDAEGRVRQVTERDGRGSPDPGRGVEQSAYYRYATVKHPEGKGELELQMRVEGPGADARALEGFASDGRTAYRFGPREPFQATEKTVQEPGGGVTVYKAGKKAWWPDDRWHPVQRLTPAGDGKRIEQWDEAGALTLQELDARERPLSLRFLTAKGTFAERDVNAIEYRYDGRTVVEAYYKAPAGSQPPPAPRSLVWARRLRYGDASLGRLDYEATLDPKTALSGQPTELDATRYLGRNAYLKLNLSADPKSRAQWIVETGRYDLQPRRGGEPATAQLSPRNRYKPARAWTREQLEALREDPGIETSGYALKRLPDGLASASRTIGADTRVIEGDGPQATPTTLLEVPPASQFERGEAERRDYIRKNIPVWARELAANLPQSGSAKIDKASAERMLGDYLAAMDAAGHLARPNTQVVLSTAKGPMGAIRVDLISQPDADHLFSLGGYLESSNAQHFNRGDIPPWALVTQAPMEYKRGKSGLEPVDLQRTVESTVNTTVRDGDGQKVSIVRNEYMFGSNGRVVKLEYRDSKASEGIVEASKTVTLVVHRLQRKGGAFEELADQLEVRQGWEQQLVGYQTGTGKVLHGLTENVVAKYALQKPMEASGDVTTGVAAGVSWLILQGASAIGEDEFAGKMEARQKSEWLRATHQLTYSDPEALEKDVQRLARQGTLRRNLSVEANTFVTGVARTLRNPALKDKGFNEWGTAGQRRRLLDAPVSEAERVEALATGVGFGNDATLLRAMGHNGWAAVVGTTTELVKGLPFMAVTGGVGGWLGRAAALKNASPLVRGLSVANNAYNGTMMGLWGAGIAHNVVKTYDAYNQNRDWTSNIPQLVVDTVMFGHATRNIARSFGAKRELAAVERNAALDRFEPPGRPEGPPPAGEPVRPSPEPVRPAGEAARSEPAAAPREPGASTPRVQAAPEAPGGGGTGAAARPEPPAAPMRQAAPIPSVMGGARVAPERASGGLREGRAGTLDNAAAGSIEGIGTSGRNPTTVSPRSDAAPAAQAARAPAPAVAAEAKAPGTGAPQAKAGPPPAQAAAKPAEAKGAPEPKAAAPEPRVAAPEPVSARVAAPDRAGLAPEAQGPARLVERNQRSLETELTSDLMSRLQKGGKAESRVWVDERGQILKVGRGKPEGLPAGSKVAAVDYRIKLGKDGSPRLERAKPGALDRLRGDKPTPEAEARLTETEKAYNQDRQARNEGLKQAEALSGSLEPKALLARLGLKGEGPRKVTAWVDPKDPGRILATGGKTPSRTAVRVDVEIDGGRARVGRVHAEGELAARVREGLEARAPQANRLLEAREQAAASREALAAFDRKEFRREAGRAFDAAVAERAKSGAAAKPGEQVTFGLDAWYDPRTHALTVGEGKPGAVQVRLELEASRPAVAGLKGLLGRLTGGALEFTRISAGKDAPGRLSEMTGAVTLRELDRRAEGPARELSKRLASPEFRDWLEATEAARTADGRALSFVDAYYDPRTGALKPVRSSPGLPTATPEGHVRLTFAFAREPGMSRLLAIEGPGLDRLQPELGRRLALVETSFEGVPASPPAGLMRRGWEGLKRRAQGDWYERPSRPVETVAPGWKKGRAEWIRRREAFRLASQEVFTELQAIRSKLPEGTDVADHKTYQEAVRRGAERLKALGSAPDMMPIEYEFAPIREARKAAAKTGDWTAYDEAAALARDLGVGPTARELADHVLRRGSELGRRLGYDAPLETARVELRDADYRVEEARLAGDARALRREQQAYARAVETFRKAAGGRAAEVLRIEEARLRLVRAERAKLDALGALEGALRERDAAGAAAPRGSKRAAKAEPQARVTEARAELKAAEREARAAQREAGELGPALEKVFAEDRIVQTEAALERGRRSGQAEEWLEPLKAELAEASAAGERLGVDVLAARGVGKFLFERKDALAGVSSDLLSVRLRHRGMTADVADRAVSGEVRAQRAAADNGDYRGRQVGRQGDDATCFLRSVADLAGLAGPKEYARFEAAVERRLGKDTLAAMKERGVFDAGRAAIVDVAKAEFGLDLRSVKASELRAAVEAGEAVSLSIVLGAKAEGGGGSHQVTARRLDPARSLDAYGIPPERASGYVELTDSTVGGSYVLAADHLFGIEASGGAVSRIGGLRLAGALTPAARASASRRLEPFARELRLQALRAAEPPPGPAAAPAGTGSTAKTNTYAKLFDEMRALAKEGARQFHPDTAEPLRTRKPGPIIEGIPEFLARYGAAPEFVEKAGDGMVGDAARVTIGKETYYIKRLTRNMPDMADPEIRGLTPAERAQNEAALPGLLELFPDAPEGGRTFRATDEVAVFRHGEETYVLTKRIEAGADDALYRALSDAQRADYLILKSVFRLGDMHHKNVLFDGQGRAHMIDGEKIIRKSIRESMEAQARQAAGVPTPRQLAERAAHYRKIMIDRDFFEKNYPIFDRSKWANPEPILARFKVWEERFLGEGPEPAAFRERFRRTLEDAGWTPKEIEAYTKAVVENVRDFPQLARDYAAHANAKKPVAMNPDLIRKSELQDAKKNPELNRLYMEAYQFLPPEAVLKADGQLYVDLRALRETHSSRVARAPPERGGPAGTGAAEIAAPRSARADAGLWERAPRRLAEWLAPLSRGAGVVTRAWTAVTGLFGRLWNRFFPAARADLEPPAGLREGRPRPADPMPRVPGPPPPRPAPGLLRASLGPGGAGPAGTGAAEIGGIVKLGKGAGRREWTIDGKPAEYFGGGGIKDILLYPGSPDHLLALFSQAGSKDARGSIHERNRESSRGAALEKAGAAPRVLSQGFLPVDAPGGTRNVAYLVQERVRGQTASELGRAALPHVKALFDRLVEARLKITDVGVNLGDNIRVGKTASDGQVRAYVVDRGEVEAVAARSLADRLFGRPDPLRGHYDRLYRQLAAERGSRPPGTGAAEPRDEAATGKSRAARLDVDGTVQPLPARAVVDGTTAPLGLGTRLEIVLPTEGRKFNQITSRGWTPELIRRTVREPYTTRRSINKKTGNAATAFYTKEGAYVVRDDKTGQLVQLSPTSPQHLEYWIPDEGIVEPYLPAR